MYTSIIMPEYTYLQIRNPKDDETPVEAATQIAASSQQQVVGMDQIGLAMNNINQAGTENAASMVQAEKAAKDMNELGQKLKLLVEQYKI